MIRKEKELEDLKYEHRVSERRFEMFKRDILNEYVEDYNLRNYDIERLLRISGHYNLFGDNIVKLFEMGFEYEELKDFIKWTKEKHEREKDESIQD